MHPEMLWLLILPLLAIVAVRRWLVRPVAAIEMQGRRRTACAIRIICSGVLIASCLGDVVLSLIPPTNWVPAVIMAWACVRVFTVWRGPPPSCSAGTRSDAKG